MTNSFAHCNTLEELLEALCDLVEEDDTAYVAPWAREEFLARLKELDNVYVFPEGYRVNRDADIHTATHDTFMRNKDTGMTLREGRYFLRDAKDSEAAIKSATNECERTYGFRPNLEVVRVGRMGVFAQQIVEGVNDNG